MERFCRTELVLGHEAMEKLKNASVAVFGIGGVGSYAAEALIRSGVGRLMLVDDDIVAESNINRQLIALTSTIGKQKAMVMRDRALDINPNIAVDARPVRFAESTADQFDFSGYDYIIDAIDSVTSKILLIQRAKDAGVPIICSMGTGNKLHPECFCIDDISRTTVCPLARVMRRELKKRGIEGVKVLYSKEPAIAPQEESDEELLPGKHRITGSVAFVPSVAGLMLAGEVIRHIAGAE
ncbi:MAG: tRNA threonylcarbamoyladenosine dehydratase [Clostridia bacterium]|nr:tRNA threonylcarbamoyladenosine dehydratase [Clostridia bacterium]